MIQSQSQTAAERKGVITWETETELMTRRDIPSLEHTHTYPNTHVHTYAHTDEARDH